MSETPMERARRRHRQARATGYYAVGATERLEAYRRFDQGAKEMEAARRSEQEGWEEIPSGATITPDGVTIAEEK